MNIDKINKIELEITSGCNAACPGCARTLNKDKYELNDLSLDDIRKIFPDQRHIKDKKFKLCGVLGDPAFNNQCYEIVEYLVSNGGWCQLSTNAGIQTADWWRKLGKLSADTQSVDVSFCIDGHQETNHIYRINTHFPNIIRNVESYSSGGAGRAIGTWIYIVFDHNEHELERARADAARFGLKFATRTGMRNSYNNWISEVKRKQDNQLVTQVSTITTTGVKEHSRRSEVEQLDKIVEQYQNITGTHTTVDFKPIVESISCKLVHEGEIFIASDLSVWPCCFLWDSYFKNQDRIQEKLSVYGESWNSLSTHTLDHILKHEWFSETLGVSWHPSHHQHLKRCIKTCALNKAYHNEIKYI